MGWGGPEPLGGKVAFFPSAASWGAGRLDVFGIDLESDALGHWWWDGEADSAWHGPELLSTTGAQGNQLRLIDGGPSAVSWGSHRLDVFCHDANSDRVQHWWWPTHAGWGGPEPLGGQGISEPQAVSLKPGRLDVVGSGQATGVQHWWWDGHWGGPELLAADPIWHPTAPTATWRPSGHLEVFASPAEAGLLHWWWDGQWEGPQYLRNEVDDNPPPNAAPSRAIAWQPDHVDVFTTDGWARLQLT